MSLQFSRSMRSLHLDSFRASRVGLILAIVNVLALLAWFFFVKVTLFEISNEVTFLPDGQAVALFPAEARARIEPGQPAVMRINLGPDQDQITLPALVIDLDPNSDEVYFLVITNEIPLDTLPEDLSGQIEIEVEYVTPFTLVRRASGTYFADTQIPVSPQESTEFQRE